MIFDQIIVTPHDVAAAFMAVASIFSGLGYITCRWFEAAARRPRR